MGNDPLVWQLILQAVLIALNAVFACAEIAVITMNDAKLAKLAAEGDKRAVKLARLTSQPARFLATIQVAITLSGFLGSAFAANNFAKRITEAISQSGSAISAQTINTISVLGITLILTFFTLVFGELVPKRVAMKNAEKLALGMAGMINGVATVFAPLVWLLTASTNGILRLLGIDPNAEDEEVTEEEIRMMVDVGSEKGTIEASEKEMIHNVFEFDNISAEDILTHRTQVDILWLDESDADWAETIHGTRHSFYPICRDSSDDVVGVLDAKTYFRLNDHSRESVMAQAVQPARFVPESIKADDLFLDMKRSRNHFAVVMDEYGGMCGIVTMNDLIEVIVGDIDEEEDDGEPVITLVSDGVWRTQGSVQLEDISEAIGCTLPSGDFDTLNGLVFSVLNEIPDDGTRFCVDVACLHIDVQEMKNHGIERAEISLLPQQLEEQPK
ncbi:MAG: HlyC/CorC family transporter [Clostridiales bacterium]|nr:HlyC/CorC family transporter [Clostridiales bacterium]